MSRRIDPRSSRSQLVLVVTCGLFACNLVQAQQPPSPLTEQHAIFKTDAGTWDAEMKMWAGGPDAEPMVMKCEETNTLLGEGVWVLSEFRSLGGAFPFEGRAQMGYDKSKGKYVGSWIDTMSNSMSLMEGTYDPATKTLTMLATGVNPQTGQPSRSKNVSRVIDEDHKVFEMHDEGPDGSYVKSMEIMYTRRK